MTSAAVMRTPAFSVAVTAFALGRLSPDGECDVRVGGDTGFDAGSAVAAH